MQSTMFCQSIKLLGNVLSLFFFISAVSPSPVCLAGVVSPDLRSILRSSSPDEEVSVIITLSGKADLSRFKEERDKDRRRIRIVKELENNANITQGPVKAFLHSRGAKRMIRLWIINGITATIPAKIVPEIADLPDVESVQLDALVQAPPIVPTAGATPEWNIDRINAPILWTAGFTGTGTVVANTDTGVDVLHPDLNSNWRGGANGWFNPYSDPANRPYCATRNLCTPCESNSTIPCDGVGHGTATMGIMAGGSAGGTAIGVAPDAKWIAVKVLNDAGAGPLSIIHQGFQWILSLPAGQAPDVVNNSWGFEQGSCSNNLTLQPDIAALKTAGISVAFAAGNSGPNPGTGVSPANYPGSFAVGAADGMNTVDPRSSRGPSACDGAVFPQVVAPGVNIRLAARGGGYIFGSGTSFSAPHAAGAMALLTGAFPTRLLSSLKQFCADWPSGSGSPIPNNDYGYGLVDVANAYNSFSVIAGTTVSSPAIAWNETAQKLHIAIRGVNGSSIWVGSINSSGVFNNDWTQIPGATSDAPAIAWDGMDQKLHIAVRGANGSSIWVGSITSNGVFNNDWTQIPGATSDAPAIAWNETDQKLHIAVRGANGSSIWVGSINSNGRIQQRLDPDSRCDIGCAGHCVG